MESQGPETRDATARGREARARASIEPRERRRSPIATTLRALAEPTRLRIVDLLRSGPRPVGAISAELRLGQPRVSKHLHVLVDAGLVESRPEAQRRIYRLRPEPLQALDEWLEAHRRMWRGGGEGGPSGRGESSS